MNSIYIFLQNLAFGVFLKEINKLSIIWVVREEHGFKEGLVFWRNESVDWPWSLPLGGLIWTPTEESLMQDPAKHPTTTTPVPDTIYPSHLLSNRPTPISFPTAPALGLSHNLVLLPTNWDTGPQSIPFQ